MERLSKKHNLNHALSFKMYNMFKDLLKLNECYFNIATIVLASDKANINLKPLKISFGMWEVLPNTYARHCFFVMDDTIIDPTSFVVAKEKIKLGLEDTISFNDNYLIFKTYEIDEYIKALYDDEIPYLPSYNDDMYIKMESKMLENGMNLAD